MTDIKILPIFNQAAPGIWHDFAHICAKATHNHSSDNDIDNWRQVCIKSQDLKQHQLSFAFGAYCDCAMVGFISADAGTDSGYIDAFYVLPEFQRHGIGRALLNASEMVHRHYVSNIFLVSRSGAEAFYHTMGYRYLLPGGNMFHKRINKPGESIIPIFHCTPAMAEQFRGINPEFNRDIVNVKGQPIFAHFDAASVIDGFVVGGDTQCSVYAGSCPVGDALENKYKTYMQTYNNMRNR